MSLGNKIVSLSKYRDDSFVVNDTITPVLRGGITSEYQEVDVVPAFYEEILPGKERTTDLIFSRINGL